MTDVSVGSPPPLRGRTKAPWVMALIVLLVGVGVAVAVAATKPFAKGATRSGGIADSADSTGIYTVARQDLSSQTEVSATLGYPGSYSVATPSGASAQDVADAQQTVTEDQQALSADGQSSLTGRPPMTRQSPRPRRTSTATGPPSTRIRPPNPRTAPGRDSPAQRAARTSRR
jgi:hypothetical protein